MGANEFLVTKEFCRFEEFCNACFRENHIGICYGPPGVGKTLSARHYSKVDIIDRVFDDKISLKEAHAVGNDFILCPTIFYTATVMNSPKKIKDELEQYRVNLFSSVFDIEKKLQSKAFEFRENYSANIIIDEADRLHIKTLEQVREIYDEMNNLGVILIGMPGLEKRLARYSQLYSRVGFAHEYRPVGKEEMLFILQHHWSKLGLELDKENFSDNEAVAAVARITNGNFRLIHRLFSQINRIMKVNELGSISKEVVEAARDCLVIGNI